MPADLCYRELNVNKIWHHADRLKALADHMDIAPVTIEVDPVGYCNHHCSWCVDPSHKPITASRDFLWQLFDELADFTVNGFRVQGIVFKGGGEPTLHPDFPEIVERARSLGFEIGVVTNGSRLSNLGLAVALVKHTSYVRVSIDGPTPETHYRVHGSHDFESIIEGVHQLVFLRGSARHPIAGLSFALDHVMRAVIPEAIDLGEKLGVDYVLIRPPFFREVGRPSTMTPEQASELRHALMTAASSYAGSMDVIVGNWIGDEELDLAQQTSLDAAGRRDHQFMTNIPIEHRLGACWASPLLAVVAADGQVYGCCNLRFLDDWSFGKIDYANGITLERLWSSTRRQCLLGSMQATKCIAHCTHPMARYNEIIEALRDKDRPHASFV